MNCQAATSERCDGNFKKCDSMDAHLKMNLAASPVVGSSAHLSFLCGNDRCAYLPCRWKDKEAQIVSTVRKIERRLEMKAGLRTIFALVAVLALALTSAQSAYAQFVTKSDVAEAVGAVVGVGAVIGVGIYFAVHANHSVTGCTVAGAGGPQLQQDQQTWSLVGTIAAIKPGERVRVSGKKQKKVGEAARPFLVEKLARDYGPCAAKAPAP
jgi:hypothetical protein